VSRTTSSGNKSYVYEVSFYFTTNFENNDFLFTTVLSSLIDHYIRFFLIPNSSHKYQIYLIIYKHADIWVGAYKWAVHPTIS